MALRKKEKKEKGETQNLQQPVTRSNDTGNNGSKREMKKQGRKGTLEITPIPQKGRHKPNDNSGGYKKRKRSLLEILGLKTPEPKIKDEMITWEEFVKMFFRGRTHTLYGQILNIFLAIFIIVLSFYTANSLLFILSLLILIVAVGSAVDITAHLWYH
ncbi:MAG: hypothetical protein ACYDAO_07420 [Thermoplasmataceae archaeon]